MIGRQILAVHLVGDQDIGFHRPCPWDAADIGDWTGRLRLLLRHTAIGAFQDDVAHVVGQSSAFQQHGKRYTRPFSIADRTEAVNRHRSGPPAGCLATR
jgi:hypothetical protein